MLTNDIISFEQPGHGIFSKYLDTFFLPHYCCKILTSKIYYSLLCQKIAVWVANNVDTDETPHSVVSHLGLHSLLRLVCPNTYEKYGI